MTIRSVGSNAYPTIAAAMLDSGDGDTVKLQAGYSNEAAMVTSQSMFMDGGVSSTNIRLQLGAGIGDLTLLGSTRFNVADNSGANTITGNGAANTFWISGGADVVHGGGGVDRLNVDYSSSTATIIGTVGGFTDGGTNSVTFDGVEDITARTGSGNDTVTAADGDNKIKTGLGNDTVTVGNGTNNVAAGGGNDTVTAGDGGNKVNGGGGDNTITTGDGKDVIHTRIGNDTIKTGGDADVTMIAGGLDTVESGAGRDMLIVRYGDATTSVTGGVTGGDLLNGYGGAIADLNGNSVGFTTTEDFSVTTGKGADDITTGDGRDLLSTRGGDDRLDAGGGRDILLGGGGADTLVGGLGADKMTGGAGHDVFVFDGINDSRLNGMDVITDLRGVDVIDISGIDADVGAAGNQAFSLVSGFSGHAGEATFAFDNGTNQTLLSLDSDGDGSADFRLTVNGDQTGYDGFVL